MQDDRPSGRDGDDLVAGERQVSPAFDLFETGAYALDKARSTPEGSFYELLTAVLMAALTFEAALNHAGMQVWGDESARWTAIEKARPLDKFRAIAEQVGFDFDPGARPFQTVSQLVGIRNDIAHGKPESFNAQVPRAVAHADGGFHGVKGLSPRWEQACTVEFAGRALDDVDDLIGRLSKHVGMTSPIHFGHYSGWAG
jgi:hypothetical protein